MVFVIGPGESSDLHRDHARRLGVVRAHHAGEILVAKRQEYVLAAQAAGCRDSRIIVRHLLPNVITQSIVFAMSRHRARHAGAIVTLGYLGLGIQPPTPDWGTMIADGQKFITTRWELRQSPGSRW